MQTSKIPKTVPKDPFTSGGATSECHDKC